MVLFDVVRTVVDVGRFVDLVELEFLVVGLVVLLALVLVTLVDLVVLVGLMLVVHFVKVELVDLLVIFVVLLDDVPPIGLLRILMLCHLPEVSVYS